MSQEARPPQLIWRRSAEPLAGGSWDVVVADFLGCSHGVVSFGRGQAVVHARGEGWDFDWLFSFLVKLNFGGDQGM